MSRITADPKVYELLKVVGKVVKPMKIDYAIGGAIAMAAAGYSRYTKDVDLFVKEADRPQILMAFRRAGYQVISIYEPHHYAVYLPGETEDFDVRIDVMVPAAEPDLSAIEYPETAELVEGVKLHVMSPNLLAVLKYLSDREKDEDDFKAMFRHGTFDPENVREIVLFMAGEDPKDIKKAAGVYDKFVASLRKKRTSRPKAKRGFKR